MFGLDDPALLERFDSIAPRGGTLADEDVPVFVNCFNRVSVLRTQLEWLLHGTGQRRIVLLDNASSYAPLLECYRELESEPRVIVVALGANLGLTALWQCGLLGRLQWTGAPYVYTDPDVLPDPGCPRDWLRHFSRILEQHPGIVKAGFGLRIDDLPACYRFRDEVQDWEMQFWEDPIAAGQYLAPIDTTFALYRGGIDWNPQFVIEAKMRSIRTGEPYVARHLDWYLDSDHPSEEQMYYQARAVPGTANWCRPALPADLQQYVDMARQGWRMIER